MKTTYGFLFSAMAGLTAVSCSDADLQEAGAPESAPHTYRSVISVGFDDTSRTQLDGLDVVWSEGDRFDLYDNETNGHRVYTLESDFAGKAWADFSCEVEGDAADEQRTGDFDLYYPAGLFTAEDLQYRYVRLPETQRYMPDSFSPLYYPTHVHVSDLDGTITFEPLCGVLRIRLKGAPLNESGEPERIYSITVSDRALNAQLAGKTNWNQAGYENRLQPVPGKSGPNSGPYWNNLSDRRYAIRLECGNGATLDPDNYTAFHIVVPPSTDQPIEQLHVQVATSYGRYEITAQKELRVGAGKLVSLPDLSLGTMQTDEWEVPSYYDDGQKEGILYKYDPETGAGYIMGLYDYHYAWSEIMETTGATDPDNGWENCQRIWNLPTADSYRLFKEIKKLGDGWYVPSIKELYELYLCATDNGEHPIGWGVQSKIDAVIDGLSGKNGNKFEDRSDAVYFSSTAYSNLIDTPDAADPAEFDWAFAGLHFMSQGEYKNLVNLCTRSASLDNYYARIIAKVGGGVSDMTEDYRSYLESRAE